jgi:hypothetical protein
VFETLTRSHKVAALFLMVVPGLGLRLGGLERVRFNEDEIHKVEAARAYLHGDFTTNLEHPILMKSLIALSLTATDSWNRGLGRSHPLPEEVAARLPNVIFGALTAVVLFLLAQEFFSVEMGLLTAFLWAIGTIAIMDADELRRRINHQALAFAYVGTLVVCLVYGFLQQTGLRCVSWLGVCGLLVALWSLGLILFSRRYQ